MMRFRVKTVELSSISKKDNTFRITTKNNIDDLANSIHKVGIVNLPLLMESAGNYIVVCGFRRIKAYRHLGWHSVKAKILDSDTKKLECIKFAITDNAFQRPLNLIEKSRALNLLADFFTNSHRLAKEISPLGLNESHSSVDRIKTLCHFPPALQKSILSNTISLTVALELGKLPGDSLEGFVKLFDHLKMSLNKQREIFTFVKEIALQDDIPIPRLLEDKHLQEILHRDDLDRNQKIRKIRIYLKQLRYPVLTKVEETFEKHKMNLKLGKGTKFIPPDFFEATTFTLQFSFKNIDELKSHQAAFDAFIKNPALKKILNR
jgi:ParB family chromosome partitioning protein